MPYCPKCGAELPEDANFCPACGTRAVREVRPVERHNVFKVKGKPKLIVRNIAPGSVEVKSGSKGEVVVDLDLRVSENLDCSVSEEGNVVTIDCHVKGGFWGWSSHVFGSGPMVDVVVSVPDESDVDVESRAGHVEVIGVKGSIVAESSAGAVNVRKCEGTVKARSRAGSVTLEDVDGTVSARSSAGSVKFSGALSKGENWFRTSVGSIDISLKGEPDLRVEASTALGNVICVPELADAVYRRSQCSGRIGAGIGRLIVETKTGSITINH